MDQKKSPIEHLVQPPPGARTRGGSLAQSEAPLELQLAQVSLVKTIAPYLILSGAALAAIFALKGVLTVSPNAQILAANLEQSKAIQEVARASGCRALICVNVGKSEPEQPDLPPEQYGQTVAYEPPPKRWASKWGLYPLEQVRQGYQACQQSGWSATWPEQGLTCTDLAADVQEGLIVLW